MRKINFEIKARCSKERQDKLREYILESATKFLGKDYQIDTYFNVLQGRLKIRKGNIENYLIYYERENKKDSKQSNVLLVNLEKNKNLEQIIRKTHEVLIEVNKEREIYFIDNVKFHLDHVKELGRFIEIEAISENNSLPLEKIKEQCNYYKHLFGIDDSDLIKNSYSDMLLEKNALD